MSEDKEMNLQISSDENLVHQQLYTPTFSQPQKNVDEDSLLELLKDMSAETAELNEFLARERELTSDLCEILHEILAHLQVSFNIPIGKIAKFNSAMRLKLDKEACLVIFWSENNVDSKPLKEHVPDVILDVFWAILPELGNVVRASMEGVKRRVNILVKIREQMKLFHEMLKKPSNDSLRLVQNENVETPLLINDKESIH
jgi:hypothetical protein